MNPNLVLPDAAESRLKGLGMQAHPIQLSSLINGSASINAHADAHRKYGIIAEGIKEEARTTQEGWNTTVMLRNLPIGLTRSTLLDLLDSQGFAGKYDFAYLPVNFDTLVSL